MADKKLYEKLVAKWGKSSQSHPLICHMIDSGFVAGALWDRALTEGAKQELAKWIGISKSDCKRFLQFIVSLHDIGKAVAIFQSRNPEMKACLEQERLQFPADSEAHHSLYSQWILQKILAEIKIFPNSMNLLIQMAVGGHHGDFQGTRQIGLPQLVHLRDVNWREMHVQLFKFMFDLFQPPAIQNEGCEEYFDVALSILTGFIVMSDWLASDTTFFPYWPDAFSLESYLAASRQRADTAVRRTGWDNWGVPERSLGFTDIFGWVPRKFQSQVIEEGRRLADPFLMIIEAPTGSGKTEAAQTIAMEAIQRNSLRGLYIAMPTTATSDQMFERTVKFLTKCYPGQQVNLHLAHGNAILTDVYQNLIPTALDLESTQPDEAAIHALEWFMPRKKTLLAPFGVGTVDQTFLSVLRVKHSFLRMFGLFRKVVIFDEVHAYDVYMKTIFSRLLGWLRAVGTSVIILSATLPHESRMALLHAWDPQAEPEVSYPPFPRVTSMANREVHCLHIGHAADREIGIAPVPYDFQRPDKSVVNLLRSRMVDGGCAAIICNTVKRAQEVHQLLFREKIVPPEDLYLLHSQMPYCQRKTKEESILSRYGPLTCAPEEVRRGIVVSTQILEQSLDLDFDLIITDLAPVDLLIQRIGREHRHSGNRFAPLRPTQLKKPICYIAQPDFGIGQALPQLGNDRYVYMPVFLHRTQYVLRGIHNLVLPGQTDQLINLVYSDDTLQNLSEDEQKQLSDEYISADQTTADAFTRASNGLIGEAANGNLIRGGPNWVRDDDALQDQAVRVMTRDALASVSLVCILEQEGRQRYLADGSTFHPEAKPGKEELKAALRSTVRLSRQDVVRHFLGMEGHAMWRNTMLARHYPVVFRQQRYSMGNGKELRLDPQLGIVYEEEGAVS